MTNAFPRYLNRGWFYNFQFQDGSTAGNYLHPGKPYWGLLTEEQASTINLDNIIPELGPVNENIGQIDGAITPESLTPDSTANDQVTFLELEDPLEIRRDVIEDHFIDENLSDQDSIFGDTAEEYQINKMIEEANHIVNDIHVQPDEIRPTNELANIKLNQHEDSNHGCTPEPNWSMYPELGLEDQIIQGKKYRLPNYIVHEIPPSRSAPPVRNMEDSSPTRSS